MPTENGAVLRLISVLTATIMDCNGNEDVPRSMLSRGKGVSDDNTQLLVAR